ncbi:MAG: Mce-associated rane protein [Mycobacterium sp.]|jgi:Mce-associated membrane protein|nr:Mce-associated rane protein [Mycobacterium sp.]
MRSRKQTPPDLKGDHEDATAGGTESVDDLAAEEAEAEAAEAEAVAAAARARARALRLRREAAEAKAAEQAETTAAPQADPDETDGEIGEAAETQDETAVGLTGEPARRRGGVRIPVPSWKAIAGALTVVVIAALLTACGYMYWSHRQVQADQQRRAEFEAAARQGVITLMSLDYTKAKEDVQRIIDNSTGQFKTDFQNTAEDFINVAVESKAITETTVAGTAVESMTDDTATVIVAASSRVTNAAGAKQEPRAWRLSVNLARDGEQMKLAKVEFVP